MTGSVTDNINKIECKLIFARVQVDCEIKDKKYLYRVYCAVIYTYKECHVDLHVKV